MTPGRHRRLLPWLALLVVYVVWGSTYLAIRIVVREMPPFAAASLRFGAAGMVMAGLAAFVDRSAGWPSRRQWVDYGLVGVLLLGGGNAFVMWAEKTVSSGIAALVVATVPMWLTLLDGLRPGGQSGTPRAWFGVALGLAGVALVARPEGGVPAGHWPAVIGLQVGALSWAVGSLYVQTVPRRLPLFSASAVEMLGGSLALFLESRIFGEDLGRIATVSPSAWGGLVYLGVFGSLVGFTAFAYCLNELPASTVGTYAYVNPVVAVLLGRVVLGEPLSAGLVFGGLLILLAVVIATARKPSRLPRPEPLPSEEAA